MATNRRDQHKFHDRNLSVHRPDKSKPLPTTCNIPKGSNTFDLNAYRIIYIYICIHIHTTHTYRYITHAHTHTYIYIHLR